MFVGSVQAAPALNIIGLMGIALGELSLLHACREGEIARQDPYWLSGVLLRAAQVALDVAKLP